MQQLLQLEWNLFWPAFLIICSVFLLLIAQTALTILYSSILHSICMQLRTLNTSLANHSEVSRICDGPTHIVEMDIIDRWTKIHDDLTNAVSLVNKCYALPVSNAFRMNSIQLNIENQNIPQILTKLAVEFSAFIIAAFIVYRRVTNPKTEMIIAMMPQFLVWALIPSFHIITLIWMGQRTTTEGKATANLVHKRMRSSNHVEVVSKVIHLIMSHRHHC